MIRRCRLKQVPILRYVVYKDNPIEVLNFFRSFISGSVTAEIGTDNTLQIFYKDEDHRTETQLVPVGSHVVQEGNKYAVCSKELFEARYKVIGADDMSPHEKTIYGEMPAPEKKEEPHPPPKLPPYQPAPRSNSKTWQEITDNERDPLDEPNVKGEPYLLPGLKPRLPPRVGHIRYPAEPRIKPAPMPMRDNMKEENKKRGYN